MESPKLEAGDPTLQPTTLGYHYITPIMERGATGFNGAG